MRFHGIAAGLAAIGLCGVSSVRASGQPVAYPALANPAPADQTYVAPGPDPVLAGAGTLYTDNLATQTNPSAEPAAQPAPETGIAGYFDNWFNRANQAQASQPHWMTPLVTVTPRLEQEVRYDQYWEHLPNGGSLDNYGTGKGLELIPTTTNEVILSPPAYEEKQVGKTRSTGWADDAFILVKQRLFSENEESGNAIVTAFLQLTAPTGGAALTNHAWVVTPTIAGGKGWGDFDIQATSGVVMPVDYFSTTGAQLVTNVALQYHLLHYFWPEFEFNDTIWLTGKGRGGKDQLFLTPGIILGRFVINGRVKASIGGGYQFAVSPNTSTTGELDPMYNHNWIISGRLSF